MPRSVRSAVVLTIAVAGLPAPGALAGEFYWRTDNWGTGVTAAAGSGTVAPGLGWVGWGGSQTDGGGRRVDAQAQFSHTNTRWVPGPQSSSSARASIQSASLHAVVSQPGRQRFQYNSFDPGLMEYSASATVWMWDKVTLTNTGAMVGGTIPSRIKIDGSSTGFTDVFFQFCFVPVDEYQGSSSWDTWSQYRFSGTQYIDIGDIRVPQGERDYYFGMFVRVRVVSDVDGQASTAAFGNSFRFQWDLPRGVSAGSASGAFMVPSPGSAALLVLAGLAGVRRRR